MYNGKSVLNYHYRLIYKEKDSILRRVAALSQKKGEALLRGAEHGSVQLFTLR